MTLLVALIAVQGSQHAAPPASLPLVVFRRTPSPKEEIGFSLEQRIAKVRKDGFVPLKIDGTAQGYADPALIRSPTMAAVTRMFGLFRPGVASRMVGPEELGPEDRQALATVLANSPLSSASRATLADRAVQICAVGYMDVNLEVNGRTIRLSSNLPYHPKTSDPIAFPKGLTFTPRVDSMTVEWSGPGLPGPLQDEYTLQALGSLKAKRKETHDALLKSIAQIGRRSALAEDLSPKVDRLDALPEALQEKFRDAMRSGYKLYGFASADEAVSALEGGKLSGLSFGTMLQVSTVGSLGTSAFGLGTVRF